MFDRVRNAQKSEVARFENQDRKPKVRMMIHKSRLIFGVCNPYRVLKEGQVHIRITTENGASTPINSDVLVVRNPCLHPGLSLQEPRLGFQTYSLIGDCLKLRAVHHPKLAHLIDCIVFAAVARPGHPAAPSMSSGGDLDGNPRSTVTRLSLTSVQVIGISCAGILTLCNPFRFK